MVTVRYSSNNSGGNWWLKDEDWEALEAAGWIVQWVKDGPSTFRDADGVRYLGALATDASKEFPTLRDGIEEWEQITGEAANALGCSCCGTPHSFSDDQDNYYSPDYPAHGERP